MTRLYCLAVIAVIGSEPTIQAQQKEPPKNVTNSIGMKFVWIRPGNFIMGSPEEEKNRNDNESQHKVTLTKGFYMGVYPVTQEEWMSVMADHPTKSLAKNRSKNQGEKNLPVEMVDSQRCESFIQRLKEKDKKPYRLPTEAEWEYAC